ncbi:MAG TPA: GNAT family N-acetyltransferase [Burkholderiaceae bacterium]|nr:GNAT family N-acetyltransferase [Burkholderiaceae bacterium]
MDASTIPAPRIRRLNTPSDSEVEQLADVLVDCVEGGASVSFMLPIAREHALAFWRRVGAETARDERALLVAEIEGRIVGTVHLVLALPENQPHRADLSKLLVHRAARRRGVAEALMRAADDLARDCGRRTLVLDTASDTAARLYGRLGWIECGTVPDFALLPDGRPCATTFFYRHLPT